MPVRISKEYLKRVSTWVDLYGYFTRECLNTIPLEKVKKYSISSCPCYAARAPICGNIVMYAARMIR